MPTLKLVEDIRPFSFALSFSGWAFRSHPLLLVLQDLSYYNCIELVGNADSLIEKLSLITSSDTGLTFRARGYVSGSQEGSTMLYHQGLYPFGAIGPVHFMWRPAKPSVDGASTTRQLWLWVHPSIHDEVCEEMVQVFGLRKEDTGSVVAPAETDARPADAGVNTMELENVATTAQHVADTARTQPPKLDAGTATSEHDVTQKPRQKRKKAGGLQKRKRRSEPAKTGEDKTRCFERVPLYTGGGVSMALLKDSLVRFSLTGPLATAVMFDTLVPAAKPSSDDGTHWEARLGGTADEKRARDLAWERAKFGESLREGSLAPRRCVLGRTVRDPRLLLPKRRTKVTADGKCSVMFGRGLVMVHNE